MTATKQAVRIGKTTYQITGARFYERPGTVWELLKGNTSKTLIYDEQLDQYTLWSGRCGLPKLVSVEFINL